MENKLNNYDKFSAIPTELRDLLFKLVFISLIKKGQKVNVTAKSFVPANSWYGSLKRTVNLENRKTTLKFINETIDLTIVALGRYIGTRFEDNIVNSLRDARAGIMELRQTYINDPKMASKITVCINNIDAQLKTYEKETVVKNTS